MSRVLELRLAARAEFDEAADWYKDQDPQLRDRFVSAVGRTINGIEKSPEAFPLVSGMRIRRALVRDFPYAIFFRFDHRRIVVIAVFHTSRNPMIWRNRG